MALDFPASPSHGDTYQASNGIQYLYDSAKNQWKSQGSYTSGSIDAQKIDDLDSQFNGSTTTFNLASSGQSIKPQTAQAVLITINGAVQEPDVDYTVSSTGGTITFTTAPTNGQKFIGIAYTRLPVGSASALPTSGGTMSGNITFNSSQTFPVSGIQDSNTSQEGVVQLDSSTNSSSEIKAATSKAVKDSYDLANAALPKSGGTMTGAITHHSSQTFDAAKITSGSLPAARIGAVIDTTKLTGATVVTNSEHSGSTPNDTSFFTTSASDARYFRQDNSETISSGDTWSSNNDRIATTAAIDARITDLVDDVGGFVPIANETSFPTANPDVNNGAGTLVSIKEIASTQTPSGGTVTIANGAGSGNTVTITGCGSTALTAGYGVIVETTTTLHTYTFHRLTPKATEVTTVATTVSPNIANINTVANNISSVNSFSDVYRIASSAPSSHLHEGDLYFDTTGNELKVYNGSSWQGGVTATGNLVSKSGDTFTGDVIIDNGRVIKFSETDANGSHYIGLKAPDSVTADITLTLPDGQGTSGQVLQSQGNGLTVWTTPVELLDEDNMATNSATKAPSQQSVKAYVDPKAPKASPTFTGTVTAATVNAGDLVLTGDLTVNGTTTTINSTTLSVDDKNIELGSVSSPSDVTADGGGLTLKGATDKTFNWVNATDAWTSSENLVIAAGKRLLLGTTTEGQAEADDLTIATSGITGITIRSGTSSNGNIFFSDGTSGADEYRGIISYSHSSNSLNLSANAVTALTLDSSQNATFAGNINVDTGSAATIDFGDINGNAYGRLYADSSGTFIGSKTNQQLVLRTNNQQALTINTSQNATFAGTVSDSKGDLRIVPANTQTGGSSYSLVAADSGKAIARSGGGVTIPNSVFTTGDMVTVINNSAADITLTQGSGATMYNTADATTGNRTLAARGMATIYFTGASSSYISGAGLT